MSTQSEQGAESAQWGVIRRKLPAFAAFAVCSADEEVDAVHEAEAGLLSPTAVEVRRLSFRLGRHAAHRALAAIGKDAGPILAGKNREPLWPPGVCGSISHTGDTGVALVAPSRRTDGVGIDIETQRRAPELETQVPRPEERRWLDTLSGDERQAQLFALFSAKESVFKAFYPRVGSFFGFGAASLVRTASGYVGSLVEPIDESYQQGRTFEIGCEWSGESVLTWLILPKSD